MRSITHTLLETFVSTCTYSKTLSYEQFVSEHVLAYQVSGETHLYHQNGSTVLKEGHMILARRNQFAKSIKVPEADKEYRIAAVILSTERLRKFALDNNITCNFLSLLPYIEEKRNLSKQMASIKANEGTCLTFM
jgi:AraC family transcriptional regulator, exoenzyme S synthesis regulatory protein ExsA